MEKKYSKDIKRLLLHVTGTVQGVGFRPFVYKLAQKLHLSGTVSNNSAGVLIEIEGVNEKISEFCRLLQEEAPPVAVIAEINIRTLPPLFTQDFKIIASSISRGSTNISPDLGICKDCLKDILTKVNRRHHYAFTNCTNCGPRYSIVKALPYDRQNTTMNKFTMCESCQKEYENPTDRRFHAQPNACKSCGPSLNLAIKGTVFTGSDDEKIEKVQALIKAGKIVAIKGIGGFHLACNAFDEDAIKKLRKRKNRPKKAFALMADSLQTIEQVACVSEREKKLLLSPAKPIVLLRRKKREYPPLLIAPDTLFLGIMLPYTPLHVLLLPKNSLWIMTSANVSGEPILKDNLEVKEKLFSIADAILSHNRDINHRIDDSVVQVVRTKTLFLRRARGYAPSPLPLNIFQEKNILSVLAGGSELKNSFCLTQEHNAYLSEYIGDLTNLKTIAVYEEKIQNYQHFFAKNIELIAIDAHPAYYASKFLTHFAKSKKIPCIKVQHHHAHIASVLVEHAEQDDVLGIAFDGTGYGDDGCVWGGEFLRANLKNYQRLAHFSYFPLPGGDLAIREVWRLGVVMLAKIFAGDREKLGTYLQTHFPKEATANFHLLLDSVEKGINAPLTSSVGRLFDLASVLLGISFYNTYEGESAIRLEKYAQLAKGKVRILPYIIKDKETMEIDFSATFKALVSAKEEGEDVKNLARAFHLTVVQATVEVSSILLKRQNLQKIALAGGVFQNSFLLAHLEEKFTKLNITVLRNEKVPLNDGGIALGEACVALTKYQHQETSHTKQ